MGKFIDITGQKFGKLTAIKKAPSKRQNCGKLVTYWECICDCGKVVEIKTINLRNNKTKCCNNCKTNKVGKNNPMYKHGKTKTRLYKIWSSMKKRCYYKKHPHYKNYGGRGIVICNEWLNNFMLFYNWAINNGYQEDLTIDRIDVNKNYEPNNCRWINRKLQNINKRNNVYITYQNKTQTMSEWAKEFGLKQNVFRQRYILGWNMKKIKETEVRNVCRQKKHNIK